MAVPLISGLPLNIWLGFLLLALITFQVLTGKKVIKKIPFFWHRRNAFFIVLVALTHALLGLGLRFWGFTIR